MAQVSTILLAHGAWANASAWAKVLPLLEEAGASAIAVSLPLISLQADAAALARAISLANGSVLLVGHSYGGAVITQGGNDARVTGLVYINGFGPDAGESAGSLGAGGPPTSLPDNLQPDAQGFLKLTRKGVQESFAQDLTAAEQALIFATQGPVSGPFALGAEIETPAWKTKPSWYLRGTDDHAIHPELQTMMANRMEATIVDVASSHVPMLSHPRVVADLILKAAG